jgi:hypothetical protein
MKFIYATFTLGLLASPLYGSSMIERACNRLDRAAATYQVCSCIQQVANVTLSRSDQKKAAKFFKDPQLAQDTRQSDRRAKEKFWKRYKNWGELASLNCSTES